MKKHVLLTTLLVSICLMAAGCGGGGSANPTGMQNASSNANTDSSTASSETKTENASEKLQKVVIAEGNTGFLITPIYVAKEKGFFKEEGLDVEEVTVSGGAKALAAVIGGGAQIGTVAIVDVKGAVDKGQNIQAFSSLYNQYGTNIVINKEIAAQKGITESSPVSDKIKALKGLKIGISSPGSSTDHLIRNLLQSEDINPDRDVQLIPVGAGDTQIAALKNKQTDAFVNSSPISDMATKEGGMILINMSKGEYKEYDGFAFMSLVAKADDLQKNKEIYQKVVNAIAKAEKFIETDKEATKEIVKKYFEAIDTEVFDMAFENNYPAMAKSPIITKEGYEKNNLFDGTNIPFENVVNNEFAEKAQQ
ncbi:ABC transporter substrate-binding protein [Brevibacillus sp. B_LB10_24]|uniref:ABC transporter substrate-binding protein n=1 Tax=Brevibacillus sp. B_LB10_24 TaxID=3380645 RepID=UPI0038BD7BA9